MKEKNLRKYHRIFGVVLAVFIVVQAGTGLYFTLEKLLGNSGDHEDGHTASSFSLISKALANGNASSASEETEASGSLLSALHYGGGMTGNIYRLLLGVGIIAQACGGLLIYKHFRERQTQKNT